MSVLSLLQPLRAHAGARLTEGLDDATVEAFINDYPELNEAIERAAANYEAAKSEFADLLDLDESAQIAAVQDGYVNFYATDAVNPYVALAASGPWIVTLKGAILHDSGGYGMLGFGHTPAKVLEVMSKPQVLANIMTPALSQARFNAKLRAAIGNGNCPFAKFVCLNSGSEAVGIATRLADANAKVMTDPGARHEGATIKRVVVKGSFHGRTDRPALYSDSSRKSYVQYLASYRNEDSVIRIDPYDMDQLRKAFADAEANNWFIEAMFLEPVMGEGDPGRAVPVEFYNEARKLTTEHGSLLMVDSIQAGLRAHGVLSIVDYPGFEGIEAPDMESYSKALNAGQFPLSVLAMTERAANVYKTGLYGNTMTTDPRGLDVACVVMDLVTDDVRANIAKQGENFLTKLEALRNELGGLITKVQGTGLLFSVELSNQFKCFGSNSTEEFMRYNGIGVIHGGANSLRFTPTFTITDREVDLIVAQVKRALLEGAGAKATTKEVA